MGESPEDPSWADLKDDVIRALHQGAFLKKAKEE
jgi:hypothetical protein